LHSQPRPFKDKVVGNNDLAGHQKRTDTPKEHKHRNDGHPVPRASIQLGDAQAEEEFLPRSQHLSAAFQTIS
jgi:hypothetical protein